MKHGKKINRLIRKQKLYDDMSESDKKGRNRPGSVKKP